MWSFIRLEIMLNQTHLNKLIAHLETRAAEPGMGVTTRKNIMDLVETKTTCGSVGCIAGENYFMKFGNWDWEVTELISDLVNDLGLQKDSICYDDSWPFEWQHKYKGAETLRDELTVMADYLKTFREEISHEVAH